MLAHQPVIFGRDAQPEPVIGAESGGGGVQIVQRLHIHPAFGHRDDQVRMAKAHRCQVLDLRLPVRQMLTHQVGPRNPHVKPPGRQVARDLAGRQQHQIDPVDPVDRAGILPFRAGAAHGDAARGKPVEGLVHQAAFRGHADLYPVHAPSSSSASSAGRITPPTAGIERPSPVSAPNTAVSAS